MNDNNTKNVVPFRKKGGEIARTISELLPHANQFAAILTSNPPDATFDELVEEFRCYVLQNGPRVLCVFEDESSLEFIAGSKQIFAHPPEKLATILAG